MNRVKKARRKASNPRPPNSVLAKRKRARKKVERQMRGASTATVSVFLQALRRAGR